VESRRRRGRDVLKTGVVIIRPAPVDRFNDMLGCNDPDGCATGPN